MAGPAEELVKRIERRVERFKEEHGLAEVEVTIELLDGSLHRLRTLTAEPGSGFVSFSPHADEPEEVIVPLGSYLVRHWERIALVNGESLVYWLRKLVFRGAYLDHRVKEGLLEVSWDDDSGEFAYAEPQGGRALLELAPTPSWHPLQYRR